MSYLFFRSFSQGLQAFVPIAAALVWCQARRARRPASAIRRGLLGAIPLSLLGAALFRTSTHQALDEAVLAVFAILATLVATPLLRPSAETLALEPRRATMWAVGAVTSVLVVRQMMEVGSVLQIATVELRSFEATIMVASGVAAAGLVGWLLTTFGRRLPPPFLSGALWTVWAVFLVQCLIYALHESAEAGLLPWSDILHAATEPYGPDGIYGVHFSDLLVVAPMLVVGWQWLGDRWLADRVSAREPMGRRTPDQQRWATAIIVAACLLIGMQRSDARPPQGGEAGRAEDIAAMAAGPHVLFRSTSPGSDFGRLAIVPLENPAGPHLVAAFTCERLSFAGGHGLCLHVQRGVFNNYSAILLDRFLKRGISIKLEGRPSRTRTSPDGRVGAVTVFVIGDSYAADFSTRTTLVDLESGDQLGELEEFSTWRDGNRFRAIDFNFWGVTFAADGNTFYAALRTAGKTHLVRGEMALRRMTVVRENVECPSLSPDGRLLAYKKRVGPSPDSWRLHVLNLQTGAERIVAAETRFIDDQVEWLDERHLLYAVPRRTTAISDVWVASIDGSEPGRIFLPEAESPVVVR